MVLKGKRTLDPLALRPLLSEGLPLSVELFYLSAVSKALNAAAGITPSITIFSFLFRLQKKTCFGSQAVITLKRALDPLALRPNLSEGLPFRTG